MKWLFAALVSVCLFACGGPQDDLTKGEERSGGVTSALDTVTSTTWCQGSIPPNNAQRVLRFHKDSTTNVWSGKIDEYIIKAGAMPAGYCDGPTRRTWCGCLITGDTIVDNLTGGLQDDGSTQPYSFTSYMPQNVSGTCPSPMITKTPSGTSISLYPLVENGVTYTILGINCDANNNCQYKWGPRTADNICHGA